MSDIAWGKRVTRQLHFYSSNRAVHMAQLGQRVYIAYRIGTEPGWRGLVLRFPKEKNAPRKMQEFFFDWSDHRVHLDEVKKNLQRYADKQEQE